MNIGDKVRLVHGREEGIIYAFLPGNVVEIEIEDGFRIPVLRNEIVTISPVESQRLVKPFEAAKAADTVFRPQKVFGEKGIYLAFVAVNDRAVTVHLINNTDWMLPFTASSDHNQVRSGLGGGTLEPRSTQKLTELITKDFESWPVMEFTFLFYREGNYILPQPLHKRLKCRAQSFYKSKRSAPILNKDAFVYQLDEENLKTPEPGMKADISSQLRERMMEGAGTEPARIEKPEEVFDLHIEKITADFSGLSKEQILKKQLAAFENSLEQAIASGMDQITFIHGLGSGMLRDELHRRLSKNQHVNYFKDAQKEKFGYGATLVKIK
ncbi:Endonuclease MutS2 [Dyadobacter sp. CECT 9275]|uniref:Endonuclease MutS2 n=1 Tax=Dyadobacter helix TaxID=2822344 RepID=A0A916J8Z9_9BACT|nr:DUF2027 domain-containing protein [Dyadobacter sp. CECT 9275]CAG4991670.1 Endonuclease MutS2 [Dyadobacter sp. CECT 9275]